MKHLIILASILLMLVCPPAQADEFDKRFGELRVILEDRAARFHGQTMVNDLEELLPLVSPSSQKAAQVYLELCVVQYKRRNVEQCVKYGELCYQIESEKPFIDGKDLFFLYHSLHWATKEENSLAKSLEWLNKAIPYRDATELRLTQKMGLVLERGHLLHELGRPKEALESDLALLKEAEAAFGKDSDNLSILLRNIAQNYYELERWDKAKETLLRCIALGEKLSDFDLEFESRFELGVLSFEQGDVKTARSLFNTNIERAEGLVDLERMERAKQHLRELEERLEKQKPQANE